MASSAVSELSGPQAESSGGARGEAFEPEVPGRVGVKQNRWVGVWIFGVLPRLLGVVVCGWAVWVGVNMRGQTFEETAPVRFRWDIQNGLNQGARVLNGTRIKPVKGQRLPLGAVLDSWVMTYDRVYAAARGSKRYGLDYTPARLMVMTLWVREVWAERGVVRSYDDAMAWRLMWWNTACGLATAVGTGLLVRHWVRREQEAGGWKSKGRWAGGWRGGEHQGWVLGVVAGGLVWFNAALLVNAHAFPQWDVWLMPFFVFAVYCASRGWWIGAGVLIALGAMLKGQMMLVAPVLGIWAVVGGGLGGGLRFAVGLAVGACLVVWPWLAREGEVWVWGGLVAGSAVMVVVSREAGLWLRKRGVERWRRWVGWGLAGGAAGTMVLAGVYPVIDARVAGGWFGWAVAAGVMVALVAVLWRGRKVLPAVVLGVVAGAVLLGGVRYGGSWSWFEIGFRFPTDNYMALAMGPTANIPAIMQQDYGWGIVDVVWKVPESLKLGAEGAGGDMTLRMLLRVVYFALLVPLGVMAAVHAKRGSAMVLVCVAAPWVLMFAILPQMHERYLLWGALATATGVAIGGSRGFWVGVGMVVLHLGVTWFAVVCVGKQVLNQNEGWWPEAVRAVSPVVPGGGWGVAMLGAVMVMMCVSRGRTLAVERGQGRSRGVTE